MDVIARAFVKKGLDYKLRPERIVPGSSLYNMLVKVAETAQKAKTFLQPPRVISADATKLLKLVDDALDAVVIACQGNFQKYWRKALLKYAFQQKKTGRHEGNRLRRLQVDDYRRGGNGEAPPERPDVGARLEEGSCCRSERRSK
jgi:hypothetical protein